MAVIIMLASASSTHSQTTSQVIIRAAHMPNITHAQALIAQANGAYQKALGNNAKIDWKIFNAGPSIIEAIFASQLDIAYVGPNPAISGYVRSQGKALRIVAGALSGGASLIVRADSGIRSPEDFRGKRVATPQLGNTQDVALRAWLLSHDMQSWERGGDVRVMPMANADQLTLFARKELDAAWAPEPWATRLIREANGKRFIDERSLWPNGQFATTVVIVRAEFLNQHPELVRRWLRAHVAMTEWMKLNLDEAKRVLNQEIRRETTKALPLALLDESLSRLEFTVDPLRDPTLKSAKSAFDLGLLGRQQINLNGIYDLTLLNEILKEHGEPGFR
ncbi:MAG: ABC transporter substrate-binding protein [Acidobacteria bacterium]|nr:ABC transporter substrate-binding protein [Acidobacteriota bacterium]